MNIQIKTIKQDDQVFKILDLHTINRVICNTNKGVLTLQIRKGDNNYHLVLDAVPLLPDVNKELMAILFPAPIPQEVPQVQKESMKSELKDTKHPHMIIADQPEGYKPKKKGGRPRKVKQDANTETKENS